MLRSSGFVEEYEIKISRSDYMADQREKRWKHRLLADPRREDSMGSYFHHGVPNRFSYVLLAGIDRTPEVPNAGYYEINNDGKTGIRMVNSPELLHKHKSPTWLGKLA